MKTNSALQTLVLFSAMHDVLRRAPTRIEIAKRLRLSPVAVAQRLESLAINGYLDRHSRPFAGNTKCRTTYSLTKQGFQYVEHVRSGLRGRPREIDTATGHGGVRPPSTGGSQGSA